MYSWVYFGPVAPIKYHALKKKGPNRDFFGIESIPPLDFGCMGCQHTYYPLIVHDIIMVISL